MEEDFGMGDQRDRQGRLRTYEGVEICYTYARAGGCTNPCPHDRAHRCEWCGGTDHANDGCPTLVENEGATTREKSEVAEVAKEIRSEMGRPDRLHERVKRRLGGVR